MKNEKINPFKEIFMEVLSNPNNPSKIEDLEENKSYPIKGYTIGGMPISLVMIDFSKINTIKPNIK